MFTEELTKEGELFESRCEKDVRDIKNDNK